MPAWSRTSQLSSVRYAYLAKFEYTEGSQPLPKILDIEVQASDKNPFGNVSAASIKLLTRITREIVRRDTYKTNCSVFGHIEGEREKDLLIPETKGWKIRGGGAILDDDAHEGQVVVVALLSDWTQDLRKWFFLSEVVDDSRQEYKRVGLGSLDVDYGRKPNIERDWAEKTLAIL